MRIPRKVILIAGTAALMGIVFPYANSAVDRTYQQLKTIVDVLELIKENYVEETESQKLIYGAAHGMVRQLDDFSQFMEPDLYKRVKSDTEGEFGGIGIRVDVREGWLTVVTPLPNTPAYRAGLYPGDKIIKIEGEDTKDMIIDEAIKRLRGAPGTKVNITTAREADEKDADWIQRDVALVRELIKTEAVRHRMLEGKVGYLKIIDFTGHVVENVNKAMESLKAQSMEALVIDLRYDPGGLLSASVDIAKLFLGDNKMIVYTKGRKPENYQEFRAGSKAAYPALPVVVLVNRYSASASEILAGALQDNKRAVIIGERTFGKASVQSMIPLSDKSALRLTIAKYYTPSGKAIQRDAKGENGGIVPDIEIKVDRETEIKLIKQAEELFYPGKEGEKSGKEKSKARDEMLERGLELLKAREVLGNLRAAK
ncbi:MAG: carboxyl-terminal processing protease [Elusimicrobia bacterium]|nr:MAG: carboxyl-terminal processing protease [Elusimicrobiota bacterium]KAF0157843.1 MAG: carboxyl-terminal processing protease [Elusimicrobiota bacterium]